MSGNKQSRRSFLKFSLAGMSIVPFFLSATKSFAAEACGGTPPAGKSIASPTEGMGKSLEYVADASTTKNPKYKAGNNCANCKFYKADKAEGGYAPCTMLGMKYVTNCGWCKSYSPLA